jgi:hypothetical protein
MDDDGLTSWNPAHFGHTDFQKESDGQLTIFFEDAHEPPDPDDFTSIADYEIAWTEWEQTQQTLQQQEDKQMFNFAAPIDNEIAQLQAKLAELETQKQLLVSSESCANKILVQTGDCVAELLKSGVSQESLRNWAGEIYLRITGIDVGDFYELQMDEIRARWEEKYNEQLSLNSALESRLEELTPDGDINRFKTLKIEELGKEIRELKSDFETVVEERDTALGQLQSGTGEPVSDSVIEGYKKTIVQLTITNQELCEKLNKLRAELPQPQEESAYKAVFKSKSDDQSEEEESKDPRQNPEYLESANNQNIAAEFMRKLDRKARVDSLTWEKLKELPINADVIREIGLAASPKSKTHQYLLEKMPTICAAYINESGDSSDLEWLPESFKNKVEELLEQANSIGDEAEEEAKKSQSTSLSEEQLSENDAWEVLEKIKTAANKLTSGDTVIMRNPESPYLNQERTVLDANGEWVNVRDSDGLTDMWQVSDVELVVNVAA